MRDIKFRAWHVSHKVMVNFDNATLCKDVYQREFLAHLLNGDFGDVLMQFTGLTDSNGVDIYEGDLLRIPSDCAYEDKTYNCFEVFYHDNECIGGQNIGFCMNRMHSQGSSGGGRGYKFTPESILTHGFIVSGNIHENAELLK